MVEKFLSLFWIVVSSLLIGWGLITSGILLWNIQTVNYPTTRGLLGFSLDVFILGIIPIVIGVMVLFRKSVFQEEKEQPAEEDSSEKK